MRHWWIANRELYASRLMRWLSIRLGKPCPLCGRQVQKTDSWAIYAGGLCHGECLLLLSMVPFMKWEQERKGRHDA